MTELTVEQVLHKLYGQNDVDIVRALADYAASMPNPADRNRLMLMGNNANPLFVPTSRGANVPVSPVQWLTTLAHARATAANSKNSSTQVGRRFLVAAPMKTGSTFVSDVIAAAFGVTKVSLSMLSVRPYDFIFWEAGRQAFQVDELALISACFAPNGFMAHHHMLATPYLCAQLATYGVRPILIRRNVFDCLISLENFYMKNRAPMEVDSRGYFNNGMPWGWHDMPFEKRISTLLDRYLQFYVDYYVSWAECIGRKLVTPLTISYENDILGPKRRFAEKLSGELGGIDPERLEGHLTPSDSSLFNKGVAGRGHIIEGENRRRVRDAFTVFEGRFDPEGLLD